MKKVFLPLLTVIITVTAVAQQKKAQPIKAQPIKIQPAKPAGSTVVLKTLKDSTSYALGVNIARNLKAQNLDKVDAMLLYKGLSDVLLNKPVALGDADAGKCVNSYYQKMNPEKGKTNAGDDRKTKDEIAKNKAAGQKFLMENARKDGVISMPEGWQYQVLKASDSKEHPAATDKVKVHYHGTLIDGTVFDSSVDRGEPISFGLNQVIRGWTISVTQMTVGSKWRVFLPSDLAYGDNAAGPKIAGGSTLIFDIELLAIEK